MGLWALFVVGKTLEAFVGIDDGVVAVMTLVVLEILKMGHFDLGVDIRQNYGHILPCRHSVGFGTVEESSDTPVDGIGPVEVPFPAYCCFGSGSPAACLPCFPPDFGASGGMIRPGSGRC